MRTGPSFNNAEIIALAASESVFRRQLRQQVIIELSVCFPVLEKHCENDRAMAQVVRRAIGSEPRQSAAPGSSFGFISQNEFPTPVGNTFDFLNNGFGRG